MKKILAIIWKDIRSALLEPVGVAVLPHPADRFHPGLGGGTGAAGDNRIRLVVVDQAQTSLSAELIAELGKSEAIRPDVMALSDGRETSSRKRQASAS